MAQQSKIQWTDATWNPWHGCKKVSPGCKFCYMYRDKERYGQDPTTVLRSKSTFDAPLKWSFEMQAGMMPHEDTSKVKAFPGMKIFTCSWSDFFIEESDQWRPEAWEIIRQTPEFAYQILTKRPERIAQCLPPDWGEGYSNVWLGVSIESQDQIGRMGQLYSIPAQTRFLSVEPLIGHVNLWELLTSYPTFDDPGNAGEPIFWGMDWVIVGGESGNETGKYKYRPCELRWIETIIEQCVVSGVPVFIKQLGTHLAKKMGLKDRHGGDWSEWPEWLRLREFPGTMKYISLNPRT